MAKRKVSVTFTVTVDMTIPNPETDIQEVLNGIDYDFKDTTGKAEVDDMSIDNCEVQRYNSIKLNTPTQVNPRPARPLEKGERT